MRRLAGPIFLVCGRFGLASLALVCGGLRPPSLPPRWRAALARLGAAACGVVSSCAPLGRFAPGLASLALVCGGLRPPSLPPRWRAALARLGAAACGVVSSCAPLGRFAPGLASLKLVCGGLRPPSLPPRWRAALARLGAAACGVVSSCAPLGRFAPGLASLALAFFCASSVAWGQRSETVEYTVQAGDTCASIARRFYGSSRAYDRIHRLNPDLGPPPHRLVPGTLLVLPRPDAGGPDARLTAAHGDVRARPPGGAFAPSPPGTGLRRGHQVETGAASSAEITFRDDSTLAMREQTLVIIYGASERLAGTARTATLEHGALRSHLAELSGHARVAMPTATATLEASDAVVSVDDEGTSRLANLAGAATLSAAGADVRVPSGTGSLARHGERPTPPRPLPPAPRWSDDQPTRFVGLTGRGGTLSARWEPVEGASRYRLEVAHRRDGGDVVAAVEVLAGVTSVELHRMPPDVYFLSVSTIDTSLFEGRPSAPREAQVLEARVIPPGGGEPVAEPYDPGDPSLPVRPPRVLPGTWIVAPVGYTCGAAGEEPRGMSTLRARGRARVLCFDPGHREVPGFDVVVEPPDVELAMPTRVNRAVPTELLFRVRSRLSLPNRIVAWSLAPDVDIGTVVREPDGSFRAPLFVGVDAPASVLIAVGVAEADERVELGELAVVVDDQLVFGGLIAPPRPRPPPPRPEPPSPHALELAPQPTATPLVAYGPPGLELRAAASVIGTGDANPIVRVAMGARGLLAQVPLGLRFDWAIESRGRSPRARAARQRGRARRRVRRRPAHGSHEPRARRRLLGADERDRREHRRCAGRSLRGAHGEALRRVVASRATSRGDRARERRFSPVGLGVRLRGLLLRSAARCRARGRPVRRSRRRPRHRGRGLRRIDLRPPRPARAPRRRTRGGLG